GFQTLGIFKKLAFHAIPPQGAENAAALALSYAKRTSAFTFSLSKCMHRHARQAKMCYNRTRKPKTL
ncbi:MAG: hypothetical protein RSC40_09800, partial [Clostridia bacterium]